MKGLRTTKNILHFGAWGIALGLGLSAQAETITQTTTMGVGSNWTETNYWSNGETPSAGNDYINANDDNGIAQFRWGTRTPTGSAAWVFPGDSLTFTNGGYLNIKGTGIHTFSDMTVWSTLDVPGEIENGGAPGATIDGVFKVKGSGTFKLDAQGASRQTTIASLFTVDAGIDTIAVVMEQSPPTTPGYNSSGFILTNPANTFAGLWDVQQGMLKGYLSTGSFHVGTYGYLDLDETYNNPAADLTIDTGGKMLLDVDMTVDTAQINFVQLTAKTWTANELIAEYPSAFDDTSSGSLTVLSGPSSVPTETVYQNSNMLPSADWNDASYWDNAQAPTLDYLYANDTSGWTIQTPVASSSFGGYTLTVENGAILNLQGANSYTVNSLFLGAGSKITASAAGTASLLGTLTFDGTGDITFSAQTNGAMTSITSILTTSNAAISKIIVDIEDTSGITNTVQAAQTGFIFPLANDYTGMWEIRAGLLKGLGMSTASGFLVTDLGRLDFDETYRNLSADLTIENSGVTNIMGGTIILDQVVVVGSATIWGETLAPGMYTGAELKENAIYGAAFSGDWTQDSAILAVGVEPPVYQIVSHNSSTTWDTPTSWDNGLAPANDFDYVNSTPNRPTRNPNLAGAVFAGRSLTISNGGQLKLQHNQSATITNLTMYAGTQIRTVNTTVLNGDLALVGEGGIICDFEKTTRSLTVNSLMTAEDTITNITITASQADVTGNVSGFIFTNPTNTFSGTWIVEEGYLKGAGLGQGSFLIKENGFLELADEYINTNAFLTVEVSTNAAAGQILLAHDMTVNKATLWGEELEAGTYGINELAGHPVYGSVFALGSSGSITVTFAPVIPEIGDVTYLFTDTDVIIGWAAGSKYATYTLQSDNDLVNAPDWVDVVEIPGVDGAMSVTNMISTDPKLFYRVIGN